MRFPCYTLQATNLGLITGISLPFNVTIDQLVVTTQPPANSFSGTGFGLVVSAENAAGVVDTSFAGSVTITLIDPEATGATLGGTQTVSAVSGVASFAGLTLNMVGSYKLSIAAAVLGRGCGFGRPQ